jgi:BlaI family transcriptional regulator, penicillinase repressor
VTRGASANTNSADEAIPARPVSLLQLSGRLRTIHFQSEPQLSCGNIEKCCITLAKLQDIDSQWLELAFANTKDVNPSTAEDDWVCAGVGLETVRTSRRSRFHLTVRLAFVTRCNVTMMNTTNNRQPKARLKNLGDVEQLVMDYLWTHGPSTSEACREALASTRPMKDSTIRTVLRRLEEKGYVRHELDGRTFIYSASDAPQNVAVRAVKGIIDRFCGGSAEQLVIGMVDNAVLDRKQLERLARKIADRAAKSHPENPAEEKTAEKEAKP